MNSQRLREILSRLSGELQRAEDVDLDTRKEMQELHREVENLDQTENSDIGWLTNRARELESRFAAEHPALERIARELADTLAAMGV